MIVRLSELVSAELVARLREMLQDAEFRSGDDTAGARARAVKHNQQLGPENEVGRKAGALLVEALQANRTLAEVAYPKRLLPPLFARYEPGMVYGEHMDNALMGGARLLRADVSLTISLCGPEEYEGGELSLLTDGGVMCYRGQPGEGLVFPSELIHGVSPVTKGQRQVALVWMQSVVRRPERRRLLFELASVLRDAEPAFRLGPRGKLIQRCHANLLRMWAEV